MVEKSLVLVGLMGAGKTTVGRRLAAALKLPFSDADHEIEAAAGCSISEIFERHGEPAFRDGERRVIARLLEGPVGVVSTGGGAFIDPETRQKIKETATSIWLRAELDLLMERVMRRPTRPLLQQDDPKRVMTRLMEERYPIYAEADIIVDSGDGPHEAVVAKIIDALKNQSSFDPEPIP